MKETTMGDDKQTVEIRLPVLSGSGTWSFTVTREEARDSMRAIAKGLGLELIEMAAGDDVASVRRLARERDEATKERDHWRAELNAMRIARDDAVAVRDEALRDFYRVISERDAAQAAVAEGNAVMALRDTELVQVKAEHDRILVGYLTLSDLAAQMWCAARKLEEERNGFRDRDGKAKP